MVWSSRLQRTGVRPLFSANPKIDPTTFWLLSSPSKTHRFGCPWHSCATQSLGLLGKEALASGSLTSGKKGDGRVLDLSLKIDFTGVDEEESGFCIVKGDTDTESNFYKAEFNKYGAQLSYMNHADDQARTPKHADLEYV